MTEREALKLALEALRQKAPLNSIEAIEFDNKINQAITAIKEALAQPEQEPVAWPCVIAEADFSQNTVTLTMQCTDYKVSSGEHWLSTTPPQRKPLTDEAMWQLWNSQGDDAMEQKEAITFARAIEAAHGIYAPTERKGKA